MLRPGVGVSDGVRGLDGEQPVWLMWGTWLEEHEEAG